ncbi:MAG TPA: hypothetical protein VL947_10425 [Cytophagales bacterium]|nr:hypothetical protein [Cytophagales bacterium]
MSLTKEVNIPKFLQELHGTRTSILELILTYAAGLLSAISACLILQNLQLSLAMWKEILLILVVADIGAGIVSNFTKGTNDYYSQRPKERWKFIAMHLLHPTLFFWIFQETPLAFISIALSILVATALVNSVHNRTQQSIAAFFIILGISLVPLLQLYNPMTTWFLSVFMIKLLLAFGIRRHGYQ